MTRCMGLAGALVRRLVPELYYVPSNLVDAEKANEHSQIRYARRAATSG